MTLTGVPTDGPAHGPAEIPVLPPGDPAVGPVRRVASELWRQRLARVSGAVLLLMVVIAVLAPLVAPDDPEAQDLADSLASPSWDTTRWAPTSWAATSSAA